MVFNSDVVIWVYCSYDKSLFRLLSCYGFHFNVCHVIITNTQQRFESSKCIWKQQKLQEGDLVKAKLCRKVNLEGMSWESLPCGVPFVFFRSVHGRPLSADFCQAHDETSSMPDFYLTVKRYVFCHSITEDVNHFSWISPHWVLHSCEKSDATWVNLQFSLIGNCDSCNHNHDYFPD